MVKRPHRKSITGQLVAHSVTSRPEIDIRATFELLTSRCVSLHDQSGQKENMSLLMLLLASI